MVPLYTLLESLNADPGAPNIVLQVTLADLRQLVVDTIDATRERLMPLFMKAEEERLLSAEEACEKLGIKTTTLWKLVDNKELHKVKIGRSALYKLSEVNAFIESKTE